MPFSIRRARAPLAALMLGASALGLAIPAAAQERVVLAAAAAAPANFGTADFALPRFTAFRQALAEGASSDPALSAFYRARDYAPIWTGAEDAARRSALLTALSRASDHGLPAARYDAAALVEAFRAVQSERDRGLLEARVSLVYLRYARDLSSGVLEPSEVVEQIVRDVQRRDPAELLAGIAGENPVGYLRDLVPQTPEYARLFSARQRLEETILSGGWGPQVPSTTLRPGDSGQAVVTLRNRLMAMGYLDRSATRSYDPALQGAVQMFQTAHGLEPDGIVAGETLRALNVGPEDRLESVIVAMERERWLNRDRGDRHIWVNLTDFYTQVVDFDRVVFSTRSIIGSRDPDVQTPEFSELMTYLEINPDWTVPHGIMSRSGYVQQLQANPYALGHLQLIDGAGRVVDRGAVDFSRYSPRTFPFNFRQPPGPSNPLGLVKFMFPNPHAIYLHDTPSQSLFNTRVRAHSNGCIRLDDPFDLAYLLLARQETDPQRFFHRILDSGQQTRVNLETPVPVHLVYRTAFTDVRGGLHFRDDVYGRDARIFDALRAAGVALPALRS